MAPEIMQYYGYWKNYKCLQKEPATKQVLSIANCRENVQQQLSGFVLAKFYTSRNNSRLFLSALCLSKWEIISSDPRLVILILAMINSALMCSFCPYCASKVNTASCLFLNFKCRIFTKICIKKCILSKRALRINVSDNFMDSEFPLNVSKFCVNNIFSLIVIFRASN